MLTPDEAASITSMSTRALYQMIEAGIIHFIESDSGLIRLCLPSVASALRAANRAQQPGWPTR